jgi:phage baseplate assembly protein W
MSPDTPNQRPTTERAEASRAPVPPPSSAPIVPVGSAVPARSVAPRDPSLQRQLPDGSVGDPSFIGRGFRFPFGVDGSGRIALTNGPEDLDCSLRVVISTAPSERVMRPEFGCAIWDLLFEPVNANTLGLMADVVRQAIARWEPRVSVEEVRTTPDPHDASLVRIEVDYTVRTTNDRRNLVYPFYVIPREEP